MNNLARYNFSTGKISLFLNAGLSFSFMINELNIRNEEIVYYDNHRVNDRIALGATRFFELGQAIGLGFKIKDFSFETRYERGNGMSGLISLKSIDKRFYFLAGYTF